MASSLIGPIVGGLFASNSADEASDAASGASRDAINLQREMFNRQIDLTAPQRNAGNAAMDRLGHLLGLSRNGFGQGMQAPNSPQAMPRVRQSNPLAALIPEMASPEFVRGGGPESWGDEVRGGMLPTGRMITNPDIEEGVTAQYGNPTPIYESPDGQLGAEGEFGALMRDFGLGDFEKDPGYQFRQEEGEKAMRRRASASGGIYSGAAMKDAMRFNQGMATDEYGKAFDRFQVNRTNKLNPLFSLAGMGQQSSNTLGQAGQGMANQIGGYQLGNANMQGAAAITRGNALNSAFQNAWQGYQNRQSPSFGWANKPSIDD